MSKSLGNAIFLSDPADVVTRKVMEMYTDPGHVHVEDPGKVEGNVVFSYLDVFDSDKKKVTELKEHYQHGGLGDVTLKRYLADVLNKLLEPIRARRATFAQDPGTVMKILLEGTHAARQVAAETMAQIRTAMHLDYK